MGQTCGKYPPYRRRTGIPQSLKEERRLAPRPERALSKKEQVLQLARRDPFLRIEEIAQQVGTTAPYVRTILSENRVSLAKLRKAYARDMERRLSAGETFDNKPKPRASVDIFRSLLRRSGPISVDHPEPWESERLVLDWGLHGPGRIARASCRMQAENDVECVYRLFTNLELKVGPGQSRDRSWPKGLLGGDKDVEIDCARATIEVNAADSFASESLGVPAGFPLIALRRVLLADERVIAVEEYAFRTDRVRLVLEGDSAGIERRDSVAADLASGEELMA